MRRDAICVVCGKEFVHYHDHPQECCSKSCREKRGYKPKKAGYDRACEVCGHRFYTWNESSRFCSKACRLEYGWNDSDPSKKSVFSCEWCGQEFVEWAYRNPRFCSSQCRSEFAARQPKGIDASKHVDLVCEKCGQHYTLNKAYYELRGSSFCSAECRDSVNIERMTGENNPNWKGGVTIQNYGDNWERQKRRAKKRDGSKCQICGYISGGDIIFDVHHIKPYRLFSGDWKKANRLSNLICLCRNCHFKVERGDVACPKPTAT